MVQASFLNTVEALKILGFEPNASVWLADDEAISYNFGNLTLSAHSALNRNYVEIISVSGVYATPRTISSIEIQLPLLIDSSEKCAAFIAWGIDNQTGETFIPSIPTLWLEVGRNNFDSLPWVKEQKLYRERPTCIVDRDWLKLALRDLRLILPKLEKSDLLSFTFQNEIFSIRSRLKSIALPATGKNWKSQYEIPAEKFQSLPKRINDKEIEISVWNDHLYFAGWRYQLEKTNSPKN